MQKSIRFALFAAALLAPNLALANTFDSYNCDASFDCSGTVPVVGGNFDLKANAANPASGLYLQVTGSLLLNQVLTLSATYNLTTGAFDGGAPRFTFFDTTANPNNAAYVYWGTPLGGGSFSNPNPNGTFASTGNYADLLSPDVRVYVNGFGGQNTPNTGETWAQFESALGTTPISFISLDLDAGSFVASGAQELLVSSFTVNSEVDSARGAAAPVPEPATLPLFVAGLLSLAGLGMMRRRTNA